MSGFLAPSVRKMTRGTLTPVLRSPILGDGIPSWVERYSNTYAVAQEDYSSSLYWAKGHQYPSFDSWRAGVNAAFTRASIAYRWSGYVLTPAAEDEARFESDPVTASPLGIILEGARTKINLYSDIFSSGWTLTGVTDAESSLDGPDGVTKMRSIAETTANSPHEVVQSIGIDSGVSYGMQFIWKNSAGSRWLMPGFQIGTARQHIQASDGELGASTKMDDVSVAAIGDFYQFRATYASSLASSANSGIRLKTSDDGVSYYAGSADNIIDITGFNVEVGFPSSYMKTTGTSATRAADVFTQPVAASFGGGVRIEARTAPGASGVQNLWQWDDNSDASQRVLIYRDAAKKIHCAAYYANVEQCAIDLGVVADNTDFTVDFRWDSYAASLDGAAPTASDGGLIPPFRSIMRRGGAKAAGREWFGTIKSIARWDAVAYQSSTFLGEGDSYMSGANGVSMAETLAALDTRQGIRTALGGGTLQQALARIQSFGEKEKNLILVVWDGSPNGYGTPSEYLATFAAIVEAWGNDRFVFVPPVRRNANSEQEKTDIQAIRATMLSVYAGHTVDAQQVLADAGDPGDDATDISNDVVPSTLLQVDGVHLTQTGMDAVTAAVSSLLISNDW